MSSAAIQRSERIQKNAVKLIQKHCKRVTDLMTVTGTFFTSTQNTENFRYKKIYITKYDKTLSHSFLFS